ncbi:MAG: hypothetical protein IPM31_09815 [Anaerolineae bacterium]|nr:hypothetical protein [Anaerolineae bacterium]MBL8104263.1 hypothetical protein [Anaerolineales bacterium]MCC7189926.1 hypothetical protein [Anaerolineales bacterium]
MDWFLITLSFTTLVRGFGAGLIYDVAMISLPVRRQIGAIPYTKFAVANFGVGVKTYAPVSILGALLTLFVTVAAFLRGESAIVSWSIAASLIATVLAFIGTARALPALLSLRQASDDETLLSQTLDRFARWHTFSTVWQLASFVALVVALANL